MSIPRIGESIAPNGVETTSVHTDEEMIFTFAYKHNNDPLATIKAFREVFTELAAAYAGLIQAARANNVTLTFPTVTPPSTSPEGGPPPASQS